MNISVLPSDIVVYGSADMPETDSATTGGAVDFTKRVAFYDISPNGFINIVSSSASDTATKATYLYRDTTGAIANVTATLTGTTPVTGAVTVERLLAGVITGGSVAGVTSPGGTAAVGDVAIYANTAVVSGSNCQSGSANASGITPAILHLKAGDGANVNVGHIIRITAGTGNNQLRYVVANSGYGTDNVAVNRNWTTVPDTTSQYSVLEGMLFEISPNAVTAITRCFATASADIPGGSSRTFYEKVFIVNNNTATSLTPTSPNSGVAVQISANTPALTGGAALDLGLANSYGDSATVTNRQTAPSSVTFTTQPANVFAPGSGNLSPGAAPNSANALGAWLRLTVPAGASPYKGSFTLEVQGSTT